MAAKIMWLREGEERSERKKIFGDDPVKKQKCEIVYPVKTEDAENDTLSGGTSL